MFATASIYHNKSYILSHQPSQVSSSLAGYSGDYGFTPDAAWMDSYVQFRVFLYDVPTDCDDIYAMDDFAELTSRSVYSVLWDAIGF